jgi:hypothetical protein
LHAPKEKKEAEPNVGDDHDLDAGDVMRFVHINPVGVGDATSVMTWLWEEDLYHFEGGRTFMKTLRDAAGVTRVHKRYTSEERVYEVGGKPLLREMVFAWDSDEDGDDRRCAHGAYGSHGTNEGGSDLVFWQHELETLACPLESREHFGERRWGAKSIGPPGGELDSPGFAD